MTASVLSIPDFAGELQFPGVQILTPARFRLLAAKGDPKRALRVLDKLDAAFGPNRN